MALQIPSIPPFNPHGNQNSVSQNGQNGKKQFQYFILASRVNDDGHQNALLLQMVGQETQDIYDPLNVKEHERALYKRSLEALEQHFCIKKIFPSKDQCFVQPNSLRKNR